MVDITKRQRLCHRTYGKFWDTDIDEEGHSYITDCDWGFLVMRDYASNRTYVDASGHRWMRFQSCNSHDHDTEIYCIREDEDDIKIRGGHRIGKKLNDEEKRVERIERYRRKKEWIEKEKSEILSYICMYAVIFFILWYIMYR